MRKQALRRTAWDAHTHTHTAARDRERRNSCRGINVAIDRYDDDVDKREDRNGDAAASVVQS